VAAELDRGSIELLDKEIYTDIDRVNGTKSISWRKRGCAGASVYPDPCGESGDGESGIPKADVSVLRKTAREVRLPVYPIAIFRTTGPSLPPLTRLRWSYSV